MPCVGHRVEIEGRKLTDVIALPSRLLRDGNTVWVLSEGGTLEIRPVEIAFTERDRIFVSRGITAGDMIVTSDLGAPVAGMPLRRSGETAEAPR